MSLAAGTNYPAKAVPVGRMYLEMKKTGVRMQSSDAAGGGGGGGSSEIRMAEASTEFDWQAPRGIWRLRAGTHGMRMRPTAGGGGGAAASVGSVSTAAYTMCMTQSSLT